MLTASAISVAIGTVFALGVWSGKTIERLGSENKTLRDLKAQAENRCKAMRQLLERKDSLHGD